MASPVRHMGVDHGRPHTQGRAPPAAEAERGKMKGLPPGVAVAPAGGTSVVREQERLRIAREALDQSRAGRMPALPAVRWTEGASFQVEMGGAQGAPPDRTERRDYETVGAGGFRASGSSGSSGFALRASRSQKLAERHGTLAG